MSFHLPSKQFTAASSEVCTGMCSWWAHNKGETAVLHSRWTVAPGHVVTDTKRFLILYIGFFPPGSVEVFSLLEDLLVPPKVVIFLFLSVPRDSVFTFTTSESRAILMSFHLPSKQFTADSSEVCTGMCSWWAHNKGETAVLLSRWTVAPGHVVTDTKRFLTLYIYT